MVPGDTLLEACMKHLWDCSTRCGSRIFGVFQRFHRNECIISAGAGVKKSIACTNNIKVVDKSDVRGLRVAQSARMRCMRARKSCPRYETSSLQSIVRDQKSAFISEFADVRPSSTPTCPRKISSKVCCMMLFTSDAFAVSGKRNVASGSNASSVNAEVSNP